MAAASVRPQADSVRAPPTPPAPGRLSPLDLVAELAAPSVPAALVELSERVARLKADLDALGMVGRKLSDPLTTAALKAGSGLRKAYAELHRAADILRGGSGR